MSSALECVLSFALLVVLHFNHIALLRNLACSALFLSLHYMSSGSMLAFVVV